MQSVSILIVEDEAILSMDLTFRLEQMGYTIIDVVDNGPAALRICEQKSVDLVLMDIHIRGEWDGVETARRIRQISRMPLIFLTAMTDGPTIDRARLVGPSAYITKPFNDLNLRIAIDLAIHNVMQSTPATAPVDSAAEGGGDEPSRGEIIMLAKDHIFVKQNYRFVKFPITDIRYLQSEGNYTDIVTENHKYTLRLVLNRVIEKMHANEMARAIIVRIHRSYAVNLRQINTFTEQEVQIGGQVIPVGRSYRIEFMKGVLAQ